MRRPDSFKEQQGYFTFAQNTEDVNYLELAYTQALSIKCTQKINKYAVAVDATTKELITDRHRKVFDYIIDIKQDSNALDSKWKLANEWQAWWLTPFKETIKLESDILFTRNVDHWWDGLRNQEVCLTTKIRDYEGTVSRCRVYRELFEVNNLPDVYNGIMYFRFGTVSMEFFNTARMIYQNWDVFREEILSKCHEDTPSTDVVYAIATQIVGVEKCTMPSLDYPTFAHMKGAINRLNASDDWRDYYYHQLDDQLQMTIGFSRQLYPVHYYQKSFVTPELLAKYETNYNR
jgi:hypothetical protein